MSAASPESTPPSRRPEGPRWRVRLWHFFVLPALAMGLVLLLARVAGHLLVPADLDPFATDVIEASRTIAISLLMASVIAWLALRYRGQFEQRLEERNRALEATRDFLSRIIEGSAEAIITLDENERVTSWNRAAEEIYGWTSEEMLGQPVHRLFPEDETVRRQWERLQQLNREGQAVREVEAVRVRRDGRRITVRIARSPLYDASMRYAGSTGIVRDVTAINELQSRLLEQERLAAVGELAAQVAHEVRNPLAGIRGACEVVFSEFAASDSKREVTREVLEQIDRLSRTVDDLLEFARPQQPEPLPTDLHALIDRVLGVLAEDPRAESLRIVRRYGTNLPAIPVDEQQMQQVFFNVGLNAAQMMDFRGTMTIRTALEDGCFVAAVRDTGPGIPPGKLEEIFKPFYTTRSQGTGLGLAIVRRIVQAHGGTVEAETPAEGGAEFRIRLPVTAASPLRRARAV